MRSDATDTSEIAAFLPVPGLGTRKQWIDAGATAAMFRDGRLKLVVRGLYAEPSRMPSPEDLLDTLLPLIASDVSIGGWAAAFLHRVRDASPTMRTLLPEPVLLCQPRDQHRAPPGCTTLRVDIRPDDLTVVKGFTVATVERAAYDMVRFCASDEIAAIVLDCFLCELNPNPVDLAKLAKLVKRHPRSRGNPRVRRAIKAASSRSRSPAETRVRLMLHELGVPPSLILVNVTLTIDGEWELDLVDLSSGLVIEYDGSHHLDSDQQAKDANKNVVVAEAGLRMFRLSKQHQREDRRTQLANLEKRRAAAKQDGCDVHAMDLVRRGQLIERPLPIYTNRPAAGYLPLRGV